MSDWHTTTTLSGKHVTLRPWREADTEPLVSLSVRDGICNLWYTSAPDEQNADAYFAKAVAERDAGKSQTFTIIEAASGDIVGTTRYYDMRQAHKHLYIGYTWYANRVRRTAINTETKLLLLQHAFETLGCHAVGFHTHVLNTNSRRAIERLGAKLEGILRSHMVMPDGSLRDTVCYSIVRSEWPMVNAHLRHELNKPRP